jgi:hypothetical protein
VLQLGENAVTEIDTGTGNGESGQDAAPTGPLEPIPFMQKLLDNPFLLLFIGVVVPTVFYLIWGILEVAQIPIAS